MQDYQYTSQYQYIVSQSRPMCRKSYFSQDYRYISRDQCMVTPTFCRAINTLVETIVLLVLLFVGLPIHQSRPVCSQSYFLQDSECHQSYFFVGLPIQQSRPRNYRNNRVIGMTNPIDYSNDFSPITSCLAFLGTIST